MTKISLIVFVSISLFIVPVHKVKAQSFNPTLATMLQDTLTYYNSAIGNIKGMTVSVFLPGQGMWQSTTGVSYAGHPITSDMKFDIGSNTKLFVAAAMLKLQEHNILHLDDHLYQWIPTFANINPNITIRQLLNHTSGVPDVIFNPPWLDTVKNNPNRVFTHNEVLSWVTTSLFPAGTNWSYSNTNYVLVDMVAQSATGMPIAQIIRDSILNPLNMDSTFFDIHEPATGTVAHRWWNGITSPSLSDYSNVSRVGLNSAVIPAGGIFSTSSEMAQWYNALFNGQILTPASMVQLTAFVTISGNNAQQYGLGLFRETTLGITYWGHGGDTWGYKSKIMYDSCSGLVVCGLSNAYPCGMTSIPFVLYRAVKSHVPGCAGIITGSSTVCQGQNNVTYTTTGITNATSYIWTLPNGATGSSSTNSITVNYGSSAASGNLTVRGNNNYGVGAACSLPVTVNLSPTITISSTSNPICAGSTTTLNATGALTYMWQPLATSGSTKIVSPNVTTTYTVTGTSSNGCTNTATKIITVNPCTSTLYVKLFLQGYYAGSGNMNSVLLNEGISANSSITDSITVELRNANSPYTLAATSKTVLNTNGLAVCTFPVISGSYYIVVKHRNALQTWSANPMTIGAVPVFYDFSSAASQAFGGNEIEVDPNVFAFYSGDFNGDENIDLLDLSTLEVDISNFEYGYFPTDINGDGNVDLLDLPNVETNISSFVFSSHP